MSAYPGTRSVVVVRFSRYRVGDSVTIPAGTEVGAINGMVFRTTEDALMTEGQQSIQISCVAIAPGREGNVNAGEILALVLPIAGVDEVVNLAPAVGGFDAESDSEVRRRLPLHIESLHRATIPATEYAIRLNRTVYPEVIDFVTQRSFNVPGYFRGILSDVSGGDLYRPVDWVPLENGVYQTTVTHKFIHGLVAAGFPCRRFGIVDRDIDGAELWKPCASSFEVALGTWRWFHDSTTNRLYARAEGQDLNSMSLTLYAGVMWRALRYLELEWAANGIHLDVIAPSLVRGVVSISYRLEPGHLATKVETDLNRAIGTYIAGLRIGNDFELEGIYAALNTVPGAAGVRLISPSTNISVPSESVF
ncbi:MAG: baseplate J/gp47 family protein [Desertifilum sp.]|nr:baseplate J/gp47 family protein [Desertifilum sp.]